MIILNADDWGRSHAETEAALGCHRSGRLSSVSAMVFMHDSERAARVAEETRLAVGLHLNLTEPFTGGCNSASLLRAQERIMTYFRSGSMALLLYNPLLKSALKDAYRGSVRSSCAGTVASRRISTVTSTRICPPTC